MTPRFHRSISLVLLACLLASLACSFSGSNSGGSQELEQTRIALAVEQTAVARQMATMSAEPSEAPPSATPEPSATPQPSATPTLTPLPTDTLEPSDTPSPEPSPTLDIEAQIRSAKVLVFEDMYGNPDRRPVVHQAVGQMDFSAGKLIETRDALGKFKEHLLGPEPWDLILISAESRTGVQGEFWGYVHDQIRRGAAVVIEVWYLDRHYTDIQPIFKECGIAYQKNWIRGSKYSILDYGIFWLIPDHPFLQPPQEPVSLTNPNFLYWVPPKTDDAGDLIRLGTGGDAVLLAGTQPDSKSDHGVLAVCNQGTLIVQTFSSHDYRESEVVALWKNYIRYTLTNHFKKLE